MSAWKEHLRMERPCKENCEYLKPSYSAKKFTRLYQKYISNVRFLKILLKQANKRWLREPWVYVTDDVPLGLAYYLQSVR